MSNPFNRREGFKGNVVLRPNRDEVGAGGVFSRIKGWFIQDGHPAGNGSSFTLRDLPRRANQLFKAVGMESLIHGVAGVANDFARSIGIGLDRTQQPEPVPIPLPVVQANHTKPPTRQM